jgi:hypothetical protein
MFLFKTGCLWHGCIVCFKEGTYNPVTKCLNSTLYLRTKKRLEIIKNEMPDYNIIQLWEHDYDEMSKSNPSFKAFIKKNYTETPLIPRDALKGGRVNAVKISHTCTATEKIRYIDITSLYPFVMKYCRYD